MSPGGTPLSTLALATLLVAASSAEADAQWRVEAAAGGVSHEAVGGAASSATASFGVRHEGARWAYLLSGLPLGEDGVPWAAGGVGARLASGSPRFDVGVDLAGQAHGYHASGIGTGSGLIADALPFVGLTLGPARLEARTGVAHYTSRFAGETVSRTLHESGLTVLMRPHPRLVVSAEAMLLRAEEGDYPFMGATAEAAIAGGSVWAHAGRWTAAELPDPGWGAGAALRVGRSYELRASFQQEPTDPLFWSDTRRYWSVGISRRVGRDARDMLAAPVVTPVSTGGVEFRIPAGDINSPPSVAGDFNEWTPVEMRRDGDDWLAVIPVAPGVHHYAFRAADGTWFVPESVENRVDDGFGGTNAVLVVPPPGRR